MQYMKIHTKNYCIEERKCKCNFCNNSFFEYSPVNYELVCFDDGKGNRLFLPTYGKYGYLDLLQKLVENYTDKQPITAKVVNEFEKQLKAITSVPVSIVRKTICPNCHKEDVLVIERITHKDFPVNWLEIDIENL